jgi:Mitochondrial carrier protein
VVSTVCTSLLEMPRSSRTWQPVTHANTTSRFYTYNFLSSKDWLQQAIPSRLFQNAIVGLTASVVSDTVANVFRVVKTTKQALGSKHDISYGDTIRMVLAADGWRGLFGRGLGTRLLANAVQSVVFTIIWRSLADRSEHRNQAPEEDKAVRHSDKASIN